MAEQTSTQTPVKTKRIRWLGKQWQEETRDDLGRLVTPRMLGGKACVLNLLHPGGVKVYFPGDIIEDAAHLAALGEARIAELVAEGKAELVKFVEGVFNVVKEIPSDMSDTEKARAQDLAAKTSDFQAGLAKSNEGLKKNVAAVGETLPAAAAPAFSPAGPSRSGSDRK